MKADLIEITEEITMNPQELADTLNENFEALNNTGLQREVKLLSKVGEVEKSVSKLKIDMNSRFDKVDTRLTNVESTLKQILDRLGGIESLLKG